MSKKIKYIITQFDGIWSFPAAFAVYLLFGYVLFSIFGPGVGSYDPAFLQPFFLAVCIVIGAANATTLGLYFTFRGIFVYLFGKKKSDGVVSNISKIDLRALPSWGRITISLLVYFLFFYAIIEVFLALV